jgi:hypothetical protein
MTRKIKFERSVTAENPMMLAEVQSADQILARLIAAAYAADHPELFGDLPREAHIMGEPSPKASGPSFCGARNEGITTAGETDARSE